MPAPIHHEAMRNANLRAVFECVRQYGPITKKEIQERTQLSWGSISALMASLLDAGVVTEEKESRAGAGRTPLTFDIAWEKGLILGIDVNLIGMTAIVLDMKNRVRGHAYEPIAETITSESLLSQMEACLGRMLQDPRFRDRICAIGVSFPGHIDSESGVCLWTHQFGRITSLKLQQSLEERFHLPVSIEHDPNCMALAEHIIGGARDADDLIFLRLSLGIGMGILFGGKVFKGKSGATGEIGHMTVQPEGETCGCGNVGCLETCASSAAILRRAARAVQAGQAAILSEMLKDRPLDLETAAEAARAGDAQVRLIFRQAAEYTGIAAVNVINVMDPGTVILGGELAGYPDLFVEPLCQEITRRVFGHKEVDIRVTALDEKAAATGAALKLVRPVFEMLAYSKGGSS